MERKMYRKVAMIPRLLEEDAWIYYGRTARLLEAWLRAGELQSWVAYAKLQVWRWAGHIGRLPAERLVRQILYSEGANWRFFLSTLGEGQQHTYRSWHPRWEHSIDKFCDCIYELPWTCVAEGMHTAQWNQLGPSFALR